MDGNRLPMLSNLLDALGILGLLGGLVDLYIYHALSNLTRDGDLKMGLLPDS